MELAHFVTGATGFVGGALALELLRTTDDRLICGVRGDNPRDATARLHQSLCDASRAYGESNMAAAIMNRCTAIPFDLRVAPGPASAGCFRQGHTIVWHCAASLKYKHAHAAEIECDNVLGTQHVLELARLIGAARLNYISTAYVAGNNAGEIAEASVSAETTQPSNYYEHSKIAAEALLEAQSDVPVRILRPSVVIGHSRTKLATGFSGMYGFIQDLLRFQSRLAPHLGSLFAHRSLCLVANPDSTINFIPVDAVARVAAALGLARTDRTIFHITNSSAPRVDDVVNTLFRDICLRAPRFVPHADYLTSIDAALNKELDFYSSYLCVPKQFSVSNGAAIIGAEAFQWPLKEDGLRRYYLWYLQYLRNGRRGRHLDMDRLQPLQWQGALA